MMAMVMTLAMVMKMLDVDRGRKCEKGNSTVHETLISKVSLADGDRLRLMRTICASL